MYRRCAVKSLSVIRMYGIESSTRCRSFFTGSYKYEKSLELLEIQGISQTLYAGRNRRIKSKMRAALVDYEPRAKRRQVSTTVSGLSEMDSMPSSISHLARSAWSEGP